MKNLLICVMCSLAFSSIKAQLALPPSGGNQKSSVTQYMGAHAYLTITYNSPDVTSPQGASREGKIWGGVVPYGLNNLNFGLSTAENPSPWRAGANENTTIEFSHDVLIDNAPLAAGKYGFHIIPEKEGPWTLIFSNNSSAWGSYFYEPKDDALRIQVTPKESAYNEWLTYEFSDRQEENCMVALRWEKLEIPFKVTLANPKEIYVHYLREAMSGNLGFSWVTRDQAANYCLSNDVNLEEALTWAEATAVNSFIGSENATTLQTLAGLQMKNNKMDEGLATIEKAANHSSASSFQIYNMGRMLMNLGKNEEALNIFQTGESRLGNTWPLNVGLARAYSALGKYDIALAHAEKALENAPNQPNKTAVQGMIDKLKMGEDIN